MSNWISVDDQFKPPQEADLFLMTTAGKAVGFYNGNHWEVSSAIGTSYDNAIPLFEGAVTHWQELPEDPID